MEPVERGDVIGTEVTTGFDLQGTDLDVKVPVPKVETDMLDTAVTSGDNVENICCSCWGFWELIVKPVCSGNDVTGMDDTNGTVSDKIEDVFCWGCWGALELDAEGVRKGVMEMLDPEVTTRDGIDGVGSGCVGVWKADVQALGNVVVKVLNTEVKTAEDTCCGCWGVWPLSLKLVVSCVTEMLDSEVTTGEDIGCSCWGPEFLTTRRLPAWSTVTQS